MKKYKEIFISLVPMIAFIIIYKMVSFRAAVITGFILSGIVYLGKYIRYKKLTSFDYMGLMGLIIQTIVGVIARDPKTYFIYPLIQNSIYLLLCTVSLVINRDICAFFAKDYYDSEKIYDLCRPAFKKITLAWGLFFLIKVAIKIIGLTSWSFEVLYGVNWLLGAPLSILLFWFTFWYPDQYYANKYLKNLD